MADAVVARVGLDVAQVDLIALRATSPANGLDRRLLEQAHRAPRRRRRPSLKHFRDQGRRALAEPDRHPRLRVLVRCNLRLSPVQLLERLLAAADD
jgi:hypothetical protein